MKSEELKQLKPGDEIFIRARYKKTYADGDISFLHSNSNVYDEVIEMESFTHPSNVILPSDLQPASKYDPCRLFKKGDSVRVVEWNGRQSLRVGRVGFVVKNEDASSMVELSIDGWKNGIFYHACHLELVTPVEELEPYKIQDTRYEYMIHRHLAIIATFLKEEHPRAKEAAEAECARLNEEYRKGVCNG